ncbi:MAG: tripartite tricarboxylate transporter substrate binding protein [Burkholderiaceae bacterium]
MSRSHAPSSAATAAACAAAEIASPRRRALAFALKAAAVSWPLAAGVLAVSAARAQAQAQAADAGWPARPVKLIVPFAPGSTPDILARLLAERLSAARGQPFVVENRPGAGGNIGTLAVARAAPDGQTLGVSITGPLVNNVLLYPKLGYDPFKDLTPITLAATQPSVVVVSPSLGVRDARGLFELMRRHPGRYNYASVGGGTVSHLSMELIKARTQTYAVHIPYNASPAAVTSILSGDTQMASLAPAAVMGQIRAGKLVPVAVTSAQRSPDLPEVPTFKEIGIPEVEATAWIGVVGPAHLPAPLVERIQRAMVAALRDPALIDKLRGQYMDAVGSTPGEFASFMQAEYRRWKPVVERARISLD